MAAEAFTSRFIVGTTGGTRSSTWRVWVPRGKSDVYVAQRGLGTKFKASLHASGECRVAFTTEFVAQQQADGNWSADRREVDIWQRTTLQPGIYLPFRLIVPSFAVRQTAVPVKPAPIHWLPPPNEGEHIEVAILILEPQVPISGRPGKTSMGTNLLAGHELADKTTLYLVYRAEPLPPSLSAELERYRSGVSQGRPRWQAKPVPPGGGPLNMILIGTNPADESRYFLEVPLDLVPRSETIRPAHRSD